MRILLVDHLPPQPDNPAGGLAWASALAQRGHAVRLLCTAPDSGGTDSGGAVSGGTESGGAQDRALVRVIHCASAAEAEVRVAAAFAPSNLPSGPAGSAPAGFARLLDLQLVQFRDALRRILDEEIDRFNPDLAQAQQIWLWGQLVIESGVPCVVRAGGMEFSADADDPRLHALAAQGADNASRILVADEARAEQVARRYPDAADHLVRLADRPSAAAVDQLLALYEQVLAERFGGAP
ncbi:MAG TPA: hypothetical protein VFE24_16995 [Pirellulales bacterium]|jgi:hypothetical protein|nr:hypothetical protein [Pirellulales bacterium]